MTNATKPGELLPCPFCGGEPRIATACGEAWIECSSCAISTPIGCDLASETTRWNARSHTLSAGDVAKVREALEVALSLTGTALAAYKSAEVLRIQQALAILDRAQKEGGEGDTTPILDGKKYQ